MTANKFMINLFLRLRARFTKQGKLALRPLHTESEIFACVFPYSSSFPIKIHATDAKMQKIEPDPNFF